MGAGPITFVYADWQAQFPEFSGVTQPFAQAYFLRASQLCQNDANSPVNDATQLTYFLYLLTSHIAWLNAPQINGLPNTGGGGVPVSLVGRISSATEGSVSVTTTLDGISGQAAYYAQTKYGLEYWTATAQFRTLKYVPGPQRFPSFPGGGRFGWRGF